MSRIKNFVDLKIFLIALTIVLVVSYLLSVGFKIPFWASFLFILGALLINGLIAEWEDNQPRGWNNPDGDVPPHERPHHKEKETE